MKSNHNVATLHVATISENLAPVLILCVFYIFVDEFLFMNVGDTDVRVNNACTEGQAA